MTVKLYDCKIFFHREDVVQLDIDDGNSFVIASNNIHTALMRYRNELDFQFNNNHRNSTATVRIAESNMELLYEGYFVADGFQSDIYPIRVYEYEVHVTDGQPSIQLTDTFDLQ